MATAKKATAPNPILTKSVTVGSNDNTLAGLAEAAKIAGAPDSAVVNTGGYYRPDPDSEEYWDYSVTFIWSE